MKSIKILCVNGVNMDLLGTREPEIYGKRNLADLERHLQQVATQLSPLCGGRQIELTFYQTNDEGQLMAELGNSRADGILINPAAWTHTSLALADRLAGLGKPYVEVHISNTAAREDIRKQSLTAAHAAGCVTGFGFDSYVLGLIGLVRKLALPPES